MVSAARRAANSPALISLTGVARIWANLPIRSSKGRAAISPSFFPAKMCGHARPRPLVGVFHPGEHEPG
jgi:hypothetical protein